MPLSCCDACAGNKELQVLGPLTSMLAAMPNVRVMDFRGVHKEGGTAYWWVWACGKEGA